MQRPTPATRDDAYRDIDAWLQRRVRWETRLTELHALAGVVETAPRLDGQRTLSGRSGVLERPGRSSGRVCA